MILLLDFPDIRDSNTILNDFNLSKRQIETVIRNLFHFPVQSLIWFYISQKVALKPSIDHIKPQYSIESPYHSSSIRDIGFIWNLDVGELCEQKFLLDLWFCSDFCILVLWLICNVPVMKPISVYDLINLHSERFLKRWTKASTTHQNLSNWKCH